MKIYDLLFYSFEAHIQKEEIAVDYQVSICIYDMSIYATPPYLHLHSYIFLWPQYIHSLGAN